MQRPKSHLPDYFPVGASYVVEGKNDSKGKLKVSARYVVFPDGSRVDLPLATVTAPPLAPRDVVGKKRQNRTPLKPATRQRREARARVNA
jgi:hypothetical protein